MNYSQKSFSDLFQPVIEESVEMGFISHAEDFLNLIDNREDISNYYVMSESVIMNLLASIVYPDMTSIYESSKAIFAEGEDLDDIGDTRGILRPPATHAELTTTFRLNSIEEESEITIPAGIVVSTIEGVQYVTLEDLYFSVENLQCTVQCQAVNAGEDSKIFENELSLIVDTVDYDLVIDSNTASSGGENEYSDDEYRYFLLNWFKIHLKGSKEAFENYFANFEGLDGYKLIPCWDGPGTIKVIMDPGDEYQLNLAYDELQSEISQCDESLYLCAPIDKLIDIYIVVNVNIDQINPYSNVEKDDIKNRISNAIQVFIDGGYSLSGEYYSGLGIGEDFIPHKLAVFLDNEIDELKNITFNYPSDYIPIADDEKGKLNSVTVEMI